MAAVVGEWRGASANLLHFPGEVDGAAGPEDIDVVHLTPGHPVLQPGPLANVGHVEGLHHELPRRRVRGVRPIEGIPRQRRERPALAAPLEEQDQRLRRRPVLKSVRGLLAAEDKERSALHHLYRAAHEGQAPVQALAVLGRGLQAMNDVAGGVQADPRAPWQAASTAGAHSGHERRVRLLREEDEAGGRDLVQGHAFQGPHMPLVQVQVHGVAQSSHPQVFLLLAPLHPLLKQPRRHMVAERRDKDVGVHVERDLA
mmetsp:Transcript_125755/g.363809  ORF Transcript_125755/g.363809 Transcript_125755/m.363809 type:complete len:257 (-) Transcript_125755:224-994(-)